MMRTAVLGSALFAIGIYIGMALMVSRGSDAPSVPADEPADDERSRIIALLGPTPVSLDDLVRLSRTSPATVRIVLLELELAGRLARHRGGLFSLV